MHRFILVAALLALAPPGAFAADVTSLGTPLQAAPTHDPWRIDWEQVNAPTAPEHPSHLVITLPTTAFAQDTDAQPLHAAAVEHSDGYLLRAKVHRYASLAMLPLFGAEVLLGQSLYSSGGETKKGVHAAVGAGIVSLFAVNTATGAWNLFGEGRRDSKGRTRRWVHGLLMMAADAGFVATLAKAPGEHERRFNGPITDTRATHRSYAIASIGIGTAGYLTMLLGNH